MFALNSICNSCSDLWSGLRIKQSRIKRRIKKRGQATKSARGMPWHWEPMKDAVNCEKPRGAVSRRYIRGYPNGATRQMQICQRILNKIGIRGEPPELKHLSRARKRNQPRFRKQWRANAEQAKPRVEIFSGLGQHYGIERVQSNCVGKQAKEGESPVDEMQVQPAVSKVPPDT